jgi:hypothetical protein
MALAKSILLKTEPLGPWLQFLSHRSLMPWFVKIERGIVEKATFDQYVPAHMDYVKDLIAKGHQAQTGYWAERGRRNVTVSSRVDGRGRGDRSGGSPDQAWMR